MGRKKKQPIRILLCNENFCDKCPYPECLKEQRNSSRTVWDDKMEAPAEKEDWEKAINTWIVAR